MRSTKQILKRFFKFGVYLSFLFITSLCLLEAAYRYQLVDFYKTELEALNPNLNQNYPNGNVLVFGDSFSGFPKGYVEQLRQAYPNTNFINCSVAGTGIRQHALFFDKRVETFKPQKILYQFYVGNDLLDIQRDLNPSKLGYLKSYYHFLSDQFLVLKYINYKLAGFKSKPIKPINSTAQTTYNPRIKKQFLANSNYLNETINLNGKQKEKFKTWVNTYHSFKANKGIETHFLILPHCVQVSNHYAQKFFALGAPQMSNSNTSNYPLIDEFNLVCKPCEILNPLSFFREKEKEKQLFYDNDPHLNQHGQEVLAQYLINKKLFDEN